MKIKTNKQASRPLARHAWMSLFRLNAFELGRLSVGDLAEANGVDRKPDRGPA